LIHHCWDLSDAVFRHESLRFGCLGDESLTKVSLELLLLPVTLKASLWLKKIENVDYFDKETNFNPLKF